MPKVRLLVPRELDGKPQAAGAEVDVDDETAADLRANGAATLLEDEKAAEKAAREGNYSARMTRGQAGEAESQEQPPAEDEPPRTRRKP